MREYRIQGLGTYRHEAARNAVEMFRKWFYDVNVGIKLLSTSERELEEYAPHQYRFTIIVRYTLQDT